jgi:hypothetical protein
MLAETVLLDAHSPTRCMADLYSAGQSADSPSSLLRKGDRILLLLEKGGAYSAAYID